MHKFYYARGICTTTIGLLFMLASPSDSYAQTASSQVQSAQNQPASLTQQLPMLPNFVPLVKQHGNAVVNISTTRTLRSASMNLPVPEDDPMYDFFRRFMPPPSRAERQVGGVGSGFIINNDGFILTNAHVVAESDEVSVTLTDKREFKAKVLGVDEYTDVALIKIDAGKLPTVVIGNPDLLEPGEWVAAIGAPFGFSNSVTAGIVSAKGRLFPGESYVPFIQTDVAVNPGNSGGPLFNMRGEVIGINSMIYSRTGGFMGLSFAIPITLAMDIAKQLQESGKVTRSRIGVQVQEVTRELASSFGLTEPRGALVSKIEQGGPAERGGVKPGDIVLAIDKQQVKNSGDLVRSIAGVKPGATISAEVWRNGKTIPLKITTAELIPAAAARAGSPTAKAAAAAGLALNEVPDELRRNLAIDAGVLVQDSQGPAARAGIRPGDVIQSVNYAPVTSVPELELQLAEHAGKTVALLIRRGPDTIFVPLPVPPRK